MVSFSVKCFPEVGTTIVRVIIPAVDNNTKRIKRPEYLDLEKLFIYN